MYFGARDLPAVTVRAVATGTVTADVVDAGGTVVRTLSRSAAGQGAVSLRWDGRVAGRPAREGRYTLRAATASATANASAASAASPLTAPVVVELRDHRFPVDGPHDLGRGPATTFGGARGHKGQDLFADCGTPVVAAQGGRVRFSGWEGAAGNYVVIHQSGDRQDAVYMHLRHPSRLREGDTVATGGPIGQVGHTGDADGCHLHFELWTAPGWYRGTVYDPLPKLRRWDAGS
jgi:murein DD-endopeptidase MepM/ murein hydrolase activator NlpD